MTSELVMRMRTCAAALAAGYTATDAADLLVEASNQLDLPTPLPLLPEPVVDPPSQPDPVATWIFGLDKLPEVTPKPCPSCGNVSARMANIVNRKLLLTCPMCSHQWEYAA